MLGFDFHGCIWFHGGSAFGLRAGPPGSLTQLIEERETQTAESWRVRACKRVGERDSDGTALTNTQIAPGFPPWRDLVMELVKDV